MNKSCKFVLEPQDVDRVALLCGDTNNHLKLIENSLAVKIKNKGCFFEIEGFDQFPAVAAKIVDLLYRETRSTSLSHETVRILIKEVLDDKTSNNAQISTPIKLVKTHSSNQTNYVNSIRSQELSFGIGPAGTGKTWLAVACAIEALRKNLVEKIVLVRPAIEAGERLGFLPGDLSQKIDPYLKPLYDALVSMMGGNRINKLIDKNILEVAPLAYMRGRTLNDSFIILDEGQNTTCPQMKMFLTRLGIGSTAVVTGDPSQIDLPIKYHSGLLHAESILKNISGISFIYFSSSDVSRHPLVEQIIDAYDRETSNGKS